MDSPRHTRQRDVVARYFDAAPAFVTIRQVHESISRAHSTDSVALSTIYRTVRILTEAGRLDVSVNGSGETVYRRCTLLAPHGHIICRRCGHVVEVNPPSLRHYVRTAADAGFSDVSCHIELTGLCHRCLTE